MVVAAGEMTEASEGVGDPSVESYGEAAAPADAWASQQGTLLRYHVVIQISVYYFV